MDVRRKAILTVLILSLVTPLIFTAVDRYQISGDELLVNNTFHQNLEGWQIIGGGVTVGDGSQPIVRVTSNYGNGTVALRQTLKNIKRGQPVKLEADMKIREVGSGEKVWEAARIIFVGMDDNGRSIYSLPHILAMTNGTDDWLRYSKVFLPTAEAASYYVEIQLVNVKGTIWVKGLSLKPVKETSAYRLLWSLTVLAWTMVTVWLLTPYRHLIFASNRNILLVIMVAIAVFGALVPVYLKYEVVLLLGSLHPWLDSEVTLFRVGHFLVFCLLSTVVFWRASAGRSGMFRIGLLILFAMVTEILQLLVEGRTPRVTDFLVDISGIGVGLLFSRIFSSSKFVH